MVMVMVMVTVQAGGERWLEFKENQLLLLLHNELGEQRKQLQWQSCGDAVMQWAVMQSCRAAVGQWGSAAVRQ